MEIVDESILFYTRVSLSKFSLEALYILYKDIYSGVYEECERSVFIKQGIWVTQPCDWNELQV